MSKLKVAGTSTGGSHRVFEVDGLFQIRRMGFNPCCLTLKLKTTV
jgi:hypothetical protein